MGFTPQHHRNSSSISGLSDAGDHAGTRPLTRSPGKYRESHEADKEDTSVDRPPSTSLLQRLTLGLGIFGVGTSEARKPSGFLLERGFRRTSYAAVPTNVNIPAPPSHSNSSSGSLSSIRTRLRDIPAPSDPSEESRQDGSSAPGTSSGAMRSIPDSQLFYSAPVPTASSRDSSSQAPSSAGLQPWSKSTPKGSGQTARSWINRERDEISVAVPETPGTIASHAGEDDLGEFGRRPRWSSGERMRFPIPPSGFVGPTSSVVRGDRRDGQGTFGQGQEHMGGRESMITSESGSVILHSQLGPTDLQRDVLSYSWIRERTALDPTCGHSRICRDTTQSGRVRISPCRLVGIRFKPFHAHSNTSAIHLRRSLFPRSHVFPW